MRLLSIVKPLVERFPKVAAIYRSVRDQLASMEEPKLTPWGFKLTGNTNMSRGVFEPLETKLVRQLLVDVDVLVNIGANVGYYCCHALSMGKSVVAFEPIPRNVRCLCQNIKCNQWADVEVYPIALSNKIGVLEIYGGDTGASILNGWAGTNENYVTVVPSSTLDLVLKNRMQEKKLLILVDIEGSEHWMLDGATEMLSRKHKPIWLVEIMTSDHQPTGTEINPNLKRTFQFFFDNGYRAFNVDQEMHQVTMEQVDLVSRGFLKFKTHNFLFCDPSYPFVGFN